MKNFFSFIIKKEEGLKYSKISGDTNKIHIDELVGYNSTFGENICHGTLVVLKFFKKIKVHQFLNQKESLIDISFFKPFKYNKIITIKKKNNSYFLYQQKILSTEIVIKDKAKLDFIKFRRKKYIINLKNKYLNYFENKKKIAILYLLLNNLSMYVGKIYPGEYSIINKIKINFGRNLNLKLKKVKIYSKKIDLRFSLIKNKLLFKNFEIDFETFERPKPNSKNILLCSNLLKAQKEMSNNLLIIGASQGIGKDLLNIANKNKKIIKIATYFKNLINLPSSRSLIKRKVDVRKDINELSKMIAKYSPIDVYYFASPKIFFDNKLNRSIISNYKKIFVDIPLTIIRKNKDKKIKFFYPSTLYVKQKKSLYGKIKLDGENKIKRTCKKYQIPHKVYRFPAINSRQSVSISNPNPPNLISYLNSNRQEIKKIFF